MNSYGICQCCLRQFRTKLRKDLRELGLASFLSLTAVVFLSTAPCLLPITMKKASVVVKKRGGGAQGGPQERRLRLAEPQAQGCFLSQLPAQNPMTLP